MPMNKADLERRIQELEAQLESKNGADIISFKVSLRGAVSVYGLGRFPVTLYQSQWDKLLAHQDELKSFMKANIGKLASKKS